MTVYHVFTAICLAILLSIVAAVAVRLLREDRKGRIAYIRKFKKGNCAIVYLAAIPLLILGHVYGGDRGLTLVFSSVSQAVQLVVIRYNISGLSALLEASAFYNFTYNFCYFLALCNAALFAVSVFQQRLYVRRGEMLFRHKKCSKLLLLGYNRENLALLKSDKKRFSALVDAIDKDDATRLYADGVRYFSTPLMEDCLKFALRDTLTHPASDYVVIINTGDDTKNIMLCNTLTAAIRKEVGEENSVDLFRRFRVYVFGNPEYEAIYADLTDRALGCLRYVNKYREMAIDFIDRYPLTAFMDERHLDTATSLVRPGVNIHVAMLGFGRANRQIFLTSVANNQFLTGSPEEPVHKKVEYLIFDKDRAECNKNLNHSYYRYRTASARMEGKDYLPLPDFPATEVYHRLDINDAAFYDTLRAGLTRGPKDVNFLIVAFGNDLENIDMAQKLLAKREEWHIPETVIFVKVRELSPTLPIFDSPRCYPICHDSEAVFHIDKVVNDRLAAMARMRNTVYTLESRLDLNAPTEIGEEEVRETAAEAEKDWYLKKTQIERESSIYACLSLRSKLHMMGMDYEEGSINDADAITERAYLERYAAEDMPDYLDAAVDRKKLIRYPTEFPVSRRRTMAIEEHERWNSYMISQGMIPATIGEILTEKRPDGRFSNGKNYRLRRHGNLTTMGGLYTFRDMISERDGKDIAKTDVIRYDYQLMDDAYWLLVKNGYKIVEKVTPQ